MTDSARGVIAVTGANGFIGGNLCRALLAGGYEVTGLAREVAGLPAGVTHRAIRDLSDSAGLRAGFHRTAVVVHLAGRAHKMDSRNEDRRLYWKVNVEGTRRVAEAAAAEGVQHVILASSVKAIGEGGPRIIDDATPPRPGDDYGRSKLEAEAELSRLALDQGFAATVLRLPLVYGPGVKGNMLRLFDAVWRRIPLPVGGIRNERSMLGIDNLVAFILKIIEKPVGGQRPFLLSDREMPSTESLVRIIAVRLDRPARIFTVPAVLLRTVGVVGDMIATAGPTVISSEQVDKLVGSLRIDSSRAWSAGGLEPVATLDQGIARTADWYLHHVGAQRG